jgi:hypothetical protein
MSAPGPRPKSDDPQADFFRVELALCFTFADIAETNFRNGNSESAKSAMQKAQLGLATVQGYLKDPKHARHLTNQERKETKEESERLRKRLKTLTTANPPSTW